MMFPRASSLAPGATESSRSMNTSSAGRPGALASIFGDEPGTDRQERRGRAFTEPMLPGVASAEDEEPPVADESFDPALREVHWRDPFPPTRRPISPPRFWNVVPSASPSERTAWVMLFLVSGS